MIAPAGERGVMAPDMNDLRRVLGLVFTHPESGSEYGAIRRFDGEPAIRAAGFTPIAEDECGNAFVEAPDRSIHFWDHETDEVTRLAPDFDSFIAGCDKQKPIELDPSQVKSVWIDPEFAKKHGIQVPPDGWKKKS